jgi:outer membrane protein insertion porin family
LFKNAVLAFLLALGATPAYAQDSSVPAGQTPTNNAAQVCGTGDIDIIDVLLPFPWLGKNCLRVQGGFSGVAGSFVGLSYSRRNLLHLGEILSVAAEYGVRLHRAQFGFDKNSLFGKPIEMSFAVYAQRFNYNQGRESSIFAFQRNIPEFSHFYPEDLLNYVSYINGQGATASGRYRLGNYARFGIEYSYDVSDIQAQTEATSQYFSDVNFLGGYGPNELNGIRTSKLIPSFTYNSVDSPAHPTHGVAISIATAIAGVGGDVNTVEPTVDVKYFHPGLRSADVIAFHLSGRLITGYGGSAVPPFDRFYIGGENDVRGFDSWSVSPIAYLPGYATVAVFNSDGTPRTQNGVNVTMAVPEYLPVSVGGDTSVVANVEYRIPISGPFTLALFTDAGVNRITFQDQIQLSPASIELLNGEFPQAGFNGHVSALSGSQKVRVSSGAELQVRVPKVNAPLRFYFAYNPSAYRDVLRPPTVVDANYFPNAATYENALSAIGANTPVRERLYMVRFSIGRTF